MTSTFSTADRSTWPDLLMLEEVALILREGRHGIARRCTLRTCVPAPFLHKPLRWRKSDVERFIEGASSLKKASGF